MIVLVGFMGCGKTTVGRALAQHLQVPFTDLDDRIEAAEGRAISDIFAHDGEPAFRDIEHRELGLALSGDGVLALGGGAYVQPRNRELLRGRATVIWLDVPFERALRRVSGAGHRPLAKDPVRFAELYEARREAYAQADHAIPITSDDPSVAVNAILERL
jgi:shikimate kinase